VGNATIEVLSAAAARQLGTRRVGRPTRGRAVRPLLQERAGGQRAERFIRRAYVAPEE